jgi:outer membrane protein TolC
MFRLACLLLGAATLAAAAPPLLADTGPPPARTASPAAGSRPLDLASAQRMALAGNANLAGVAERVQQAQRQARLSRPENGPVIELPSSLARSDPSPDAPTPLEPTPIEPNDALRASLGARWTFYRSLQQRFDTAATRFGEQQSLAALAEAKRLLLAAVAESFFQAQLARERRVIAAADLAARQRLVALARTTRRPPLATAQQIAALEAGVAVAQQDLAARRQAEEFSLRMLAVLLGLPQEQALHGIELAAIAPETAQQLQPPENETLALYAEQHRPDVLEAEFALRRLNAANHSAQAGLEPDLTLRGALESELRRNERFSSDDVDGSVGIFMEIPLSTESDRRARQAETRRRRNEAQQTLAAVRAVARGEVLDAAQRVSETQQRLLHERQQMLWAEQQRHAVAQQYASGHATLEALGLSQQAASTARHNLAVARIGLHEAWAQLDTSTGRILAAFDTQAGPPLPSGG